jgi:peptide/nickel transport system substrate-binding protein
VPQPSEDGLTYTFKLRQGANWNAPSGPRQITSADFERGIKRMCNPALGSAALTYYSGSDRRHGRILQRLRQGSSRPVEAMKAYYRRQRHFRHRAPDDETIVIKLTAAAPATSSTCCRCRPPSPAPVEVLDYLPDSPDYRTKFIASGPLHAECYTPDSAMQLTRNACLEGGDRSVAQGYVDEIEITFGLQVDAIMQQLQSGDGDMTYDVTIPPAVLQTLTAQATEKVMTVRRQYQFHFHQHGVGQQQRALRDLRVRQALEYAVDKAAAVQQQGGPSVAQPVNGIFGWACSATTNSASIPSTDAKGDPDKPRRCSPRPGFPNGITLKMPFRNKGWSQPLRRPYRPRWRAPGSRSS